MSRGRLPSSVREGWQGEGAGSRYANQRWRSGRRSVRDGVLVGRVLSRYGLQGRVLDVPCGTGRLRPALDVPARSYVGLDVSASMLGVAADGGAERLVRGDVEGLPFADGAFDAVVCCRLLHHLSGEQALEQAVRELVRVSGRLVVASFWDRASVSNLRRRARARRRASRRTARAKEAVAEVFARAGAPVVAWEHSLRFFSMQTFAVAEKLG